VLLAAVTPVDVLYYAIVHGIGQDCRGCRLVNKTTGNYPPYVVAVVCREHHVPVVQVFCGGSELFILAQSRLVCEHVRRPVGDNPCAGGVVLDTPTVGPTTSGPTVVRCTQVRTTNIVDDDFVGGVRDPDVITFGVVVPVLIVVTGVVKRESYLYGPTLLLL
jgi:hypothetical protein